MRTETTAQDEVRNAAMAFDRGLVEAARHVRARSRPIPVSVPLALAGLALAFTILPKRLRKPLLSAALPLAATSLRGLFR